MAHYAFIKDNIVTEVITGKDETETAPDGFSDWEEYYLTKRPGQDSCKRTSYNTVMNTHEEGGTPFRGNYAGIGFTYDSSNDVFYSAQPYPSWTISADTNWVWTAPLAYPSDGDGETGYVWNEEAYQADNTTGWDLVE
tara:strand:+ start:1392 stop:1805 length:414 start_codon:yes stop_codon:yes gene_type:complete